MQVHRLLFGFLAVVVSEILLNSWRYFRLQRYFRMYGSYLENPSWKFTEIQLQAEKLLREAGVEDSFCGTCRTHWIWTYSYAQCFRVS